jgi:hypothetical protein
VLLSGRDHRLRFAGQGDKRSSGNVHISDKFKFRVWLDALADSDECCVHLIRSWIVAVKYFVAAGICNCVALDAVLERVSRFGRQHKVRSFQGPVRQAV